MATIICEQHVCTCLYFWENNVYAWLLKKLKMKSFWNKATKHIYICSFSWHFYPKQFTIAIYVKGLTPLEQLGIKFLAKGMCLIHCAITTPINMCPPEFGCWWMLDVVVKMDGCCCQEYLLQNDLKIILPDQSHKTIHCFKICSVLGGVIHSWVDNDLHNDPNNELHNEPFSQAYH